MTAPAIASPPCPVCGGQMYDNRATKKSPKQPDFKCKRYKEGCAGVIWPPKAQAGMPPYLQNQEAEDAAELAGKIGPVEKPKMRDAYKSLTEWVLTDIARIYEDHEFPFPPEVAAACVQTLFIQACYDGKVE